MYGDKLSRAQVAVWASFTGLTVADTTRFRRQLDEAGAEALVVKNSLLGIALGNADMPVDPMFAEDANMVTFAYDDIAGAAKALTAFAAEHRDLVRIKGGLIEGRLATDAQIRSLATIPSREVLLAQVLSGLQSPISGLASVLSGTIRSMMYVLQARSEQLESAAN
jgi:large subunit ribosomal protein L10